MASHNEIQQNFPLNKGFVPLTFLSPDMQFQQQDEQQSNISSTIHLGPSPRPQSKTKKSKKLSQKPPKKNLSAPLHFDQALAKRRGHKYLSRAIVALLNYQIDISNFQD